MNNLIGQHKYFVGEFDGEIMDHGQINVMGVCKLETGEKLQEVGFTEPPTLDLAENMLLMCGPTVNVSTHVAERSANLGGYDIETIFNEYGDYESSISRINSEYLSNPQLLGFLIRIGLQAGDPNTNHFTALKKDTSCPRLFKYIESRIPDGDAPGPYSHCLEMGESVVEHFLHQHKDRIKSIQSVFKRT